MTHPACREEDVAPERGYAVGYEAGCVLGELVQRNLSCASASSLAVKKSEASPSQRANALAADAKLEADPGISDLDVGDISTLCNPEPQGSSSDAVFQIE
jgi:hypothetical protein